MPASGSSVGTAAPEAPRILIAGGGTGGHLVPALNLARALRRAEPRVRILLLGARRGVEARVLPEGEFPFRLLPQQPLYRVRPWRNWRLLASAPAVGLGLVRVFVSFRPDLVLGTGGYASGPAVLWGRLTGRRTAIQEQNVEPGLVTRRLARWVDQVHLGYPEAQARLRPGRRTRVLCRGNPVDLTEPGKAFDWPAGRVLLIAGGSQGARSLNERWLADLERIEAADIGWPEDLHVVWVTGPAHFEGVRDRVSRLPVAERVRPVPFIPRLGAQLGHVTLAVCRAGAMTVAELAAAGVPAIYVPLPASAGGHQSANARAMARSGSCLVREEADLEEGELLRLALEILADEPRRARMAESALSRGAPDAAARIAADLLRLAVEGK